MAIRDLFFSIVAKDETGAAFASVKRRMAETEGAARGMRDRLRGAGEAAKSFGKKASVASAGVALLFRDSLALYDTQAKAEAKVAQAIKATGAAAGFTAGELKKEASALQGVSRFGDEDILNNVTAQLLTFKEISGETFKDAQLAALDLATVLDSDLKSVSIQLGKALNAPVQGLSALSEAGITFTEDQKAVVAALVETGRVGEAQRLILDEIASAYGGQAKAAAEAGLGSLDQLSNAWGDLKEDVGRVISEVLPPIVSFFRSAVDGFLSLPEPVRNFGVVLGGLAVVVGPLVGVLGLMVTAAAAISAPVLLGVAAVTALTAGVVAFLPQIQAAASWLGEKLAPAVDLVRDGLKLLSAHVEVVTSWLGDRLGGALQSLRDAFAAGLSDPLDMARNLGEFLLAINPVSIAANAMLDTFKSVFPGATQYVADMVGAVKSWLLDRLDAVFETIGRRVEWVEEKFAWLYDRVVGNSWVPDLVDEVGDHFGRLEGEMVEPVRKAADEVDSEYQKLGQSISGHLKTLATDGEITWRGFMGTLLDIGREYSDRIVSEAFDELGKGIGQALQSGFGGAGGSGGSAGGGGFWAGLADAGANLLSNLPGFADGGAFTVRGRAGRDRNLAAVRLSEGENVQVTKRGQPAGQTVVNVTIQTPNPAAFNASRAQIGRELAAAVAVGQRAA